MLPTETKLPYVSYTKVWTEKDFTKGSLRWNRWSYFCGRLQVAVGLGVVQLGKISTFTLMFTEVTQGIHVTVDTLYQPEYSHPAREHFVFTYRIVIENRSGYTIQLLRRKWNIYDGTGIIREVEGDGVLGLQPVLEPGDAHEYVSGCNLRTTIGKMIGQYEMVRVVDGKQLSVAIPEFTMVAPFRLN